VGSFSLPGLLCLLGTTLGATIALAFALMRWAIVEVPTVHYGVVLFLKKRTGRELGEGWHWIIPFFNSVELFSLEVKTLPLADPVTHKRVSFFSKDGREVVVEGSLQWRPDRHLLRDVFMTMDEKTIVDGLRDAVKAELGVIGGTKNAVAFIENREAINFLINCVLRLSQPPHVEKELSPVKRLAYYAKNAIEIKKRLDDEVNQADDRSHVEQLYGIDVVKFALADVDFSPETRKTMEMKKQTEEKLKADQLQHNHVVAMAERLKALGLDPDVAVNAAQVTIDQAEKKIFSVEGLGKFFGDKVPKIIISR
jgi:regulator of protease activity HflC (stomatin/prohibitin superfamily)